MKLLKPLIIAFSVYSKIPMLQFEWKEEDMKYVLCFFPWVGAVIGGVVYLWNWLCDTFGIGELCYVLIGAAVPLFVTGGFHVDGFMDTMDAFHSYQPKERKLEILKDSHIGAFAVIMLAVYGMFYLAAFSEITDTSLLRIVCSGFFLARCLSGIGVVSFPAAKKEGMLFWFASNAQRVIVKGVLYVQCAACIAFMLIQSFFAGITIAAAAFFVLVYYYFRCKKEFGGITGDTAGYFLVLCEGVIMAVAAFINIMTKIEV